MKHIIKGGIEDHMKCFCKPKIKKRCVECNGGQEPNCFVCNGEGLVMATEDDIILNEEPLIIVHNK